MFLVIFWIFWVKKGNSRHHTLLHWGKGNNQELTDTCKREERNVETAPSVYPQPIVSQSQNRSAPPPLAFSAFMPRNSPRCVLVSTLNDTLVGIKMSKTRLNSQHASHSKV
uniref:Secreted protein n=1 Tax=Glossina pallidipes TaxID=7398 RepID=A0A1B0A3M6_GLOPL